MDKARYNFIFARQEAFRAQCLFTGATQESGVKGQQKEPCASVRGLGSSIKMTGPAMSREEQKHTLYLNPPS